MTDPTARPAGALLAGRTAAVDVPVGAEDWLTPAERARAAVLMRAGDRADYLAAHVLVRRCAALVLGTTPERLTVVQHCSTCGRTGHGRPSLVEAPELHVSLTHTRGYVAAAVDTAEVAVDTERLLDREWVAEVSGTVLSAAECEWVLASGDPQLAFAKLWVRKESLIKLGLATLDTLAKVDMSAAIGDSSTWQEYTVFGWTDPIGEVVGAVVASRMPELVRFLD